MDPVNLTFFNAPVLRLAKKMLGQLLIHELADRTLVGRIVETEAYRGPDDEAAHSFQNRRTKRTEIMYDKPGLAYTYQMHTHTLLNIVAGPIDKPHAVLIRAVEPIYGLEEMYRFRGGHIKHKTELTNGPGKLTQAFQIKMKYYGHPMTNAPLYIAEGRPSEKIESSPRVGVRNTGEAANYQWRYYEKGNPYVSRFR